MGKTNKSKTNPPEDFNDGNPYQVSKVSSFQKYTGSKTRKMEAGTNTYYTTTVVTQNGKDKNGNIIYKREIYSFNNAKDAKNFKENVENEDLGLQKQALFHNKNNTVNILFIKNVYFVKRNVHLCFITIV